MSLALVQSRALLGLEAPSVTVEVHLANGLPSFTLVGLADVEVKEARERVRSALQNAGLEFPHNKRIKCSQALFARNGRGTARSRALILTGCPRRLVVDNALGRPPPRKRVVHNCEARGGQLLQRTF